MKILSSLLSKLWQAERPEPPKVTVSQVGIQARAIRHLIAHGTIDARTVFLMGTTDAHKMFTRLRRMGLLFDGNDPCGHTLVKNRSGNGYFRRHKWTGKLPESWNQPMKAK